jgi:hypothetical protein
MPHLGRGYPHNGVQIRVVGRIAAKDLDPYGALLQASRPACEGLIHYVLQKARVAFAVDEKITRQDALEFLTNGVTLGVCSREPKLAPMG